MTNRKAKLWGALLAMLLIHSAIFVRCAVRKSTCFDEGAHIAAGLAYLKFSEFSIYNLSPPLMRMWDALPAYAAGAQIPPAKPRRDDPSSSRHWLYFDAFQRDNLQNLHRYVVWGRMMQLPVSLALALCVFVAARRLHGELSGIAACAIYCFSPTILAHASTVGTDLGLAASAFGALLAWTRFAGTGSKGALLIASIFIAAAHAIKFNAVLLWPAIVIVAPLSGRRRDALVGIVVAMVMTYTVVCLSYGFRLTGRRLDFFHFESSMMLRLQTSLPGAMRIPVPQDLLEGLDAQKVEADGAYVTPLFGQARFGGDWRYYPWLVLTKTTVGGLALLLLCVISLALLRSSRDEWPYCIWLGVFLAGMLLMTQINIGLRYLLPIYPAAIVLMARVLVLPKLGPVALLAMAMLCVESIVASPRHHSFVNFAAAKVRDQVPDLDAGQSLIELREWMRSASVPEITLLHHGRIDAQAYGIRTLPQARYFAIGVSFLHGVPERSTQGFVFVRSWRHLCAIKPVVDLGGMKIFSAEDVGDDAFVVIQSWDEAVREPEMLPLIRHDQP